MAGKHAADNPDRVPHADLPPAARKDLSKAVKAARDKKNQDNGGKGGKKK